MLIEFHVTNYHSIKDECIFSMEAYTRDRKNLNAVRTPDKNTHLLLSAAIFGPNASGKTTVISSLNFLKNLVKTSGNFSINSYIEDQSFAFTNDKSPTEISIEFLNDGRYIYSISIFNGKIHKENLYCDNKLIFNRDKNSIQFGSIAKREINKLEFVWSLTNPNSLFLSKCSQSNIAIVKKAYEWITEKIICMDDKSRLNTELLSKVLEAHKSELIDMLTATDLGISDITLQKTDISAALNKDPSEIKRQKLKSDLGLQKYSIRYDLVLDGKKKMYHSDMDLESKGTIATIGLASEWIYALETGSLLIVDELESSLHPLLVDHLLNLISDPVTNPKGAQVIFTTHDSLIPKRNELRRDQIWFTARNPNVGKTVLYSLLDYDVRSDLEFTNNYLKGRFGAIPMIKNRRKTND